MSGGLGSRTTVYGVCADCGAVAWELLNGVSDRCMGCDPTAYQPDDDEDYEYDPTLEGEGA